MEKSPMPSAATEIVKRKLSHFELCAHQAVEFRHKTTWFEHVELVPHALTQTHLDDIDLSIEIFGKRLNYPIFISGMTGGTEEVGQFNRDMAALAERWGIGFGVGSQRVMLRYPETRASFAVRDVAPNVLLFGNLGIAQACELATDQIIHLAQSIGADALCIHFNTAMEVIQREGDHDFRGSLAALQRLANESPLPLVAKETGCGFGYEAGAQIASTGIEWIDVAGAGGTSWVGVETLRNRALRHLGEAFWDWGLPTAASIAELRPLNLNLIASGGIRTGMHAAKALALGAKAVGMALPFLRAYVNGGTRGVDDFLEAFTAELRIAVMLCGVERAVDLRPHHVVIGGELRAWLTERNSILKGNRPA
jgi:isopentenyl-diphosphate Delta-isomerase